MYMYQVISKLSDFYIYTVTIIDITPKKTSAVYACFAIRSKNYS